MKILTESVDEVKLSPLDAPRPGKCKLPLQKYEMRSLERIADLEKKMDNIPKSSPLWLKLRKQKLAQQARLEARQKESRKTDEVS